MRDAPTPTITRSPGVFVGGFNPGGGRSGRDPRLDAVVAEAAERLRARYGLDVSIRFNSDRESGGAFLVLPVSVGITAARRTHDRIRAIADRYDGDFAETCERMNVDPQGPSEQIVLNVFVDAAELRDPTVANCRGACPYAYLPTTDLDQAMAVLERVLAR